MLSSHIAEGTHITAVGADDEGKQELDPHLFKDADRVVVDSKSQCRMLGDTSCALKKGLIDLEGVTELGDVIENPSLRRSSDEEVTIVDFTGIAIQDLQIAQACLKRLLP